jgi:hypothetical protein
VKRLCFVFFVFALGFSFTGCDDPTSSKDDSPVVTDVKVSSQNNLATTTWLTQLTKGQTYYFFIFASDKDLDISRCVITYSTGRTQTIPAIGQTTVSDCFVGSIIPQSTGTITASVYVEDAKGNRSNTKSITVIVSG